MRILDRSVYVGPSLYARFPVIRLELDLEQLEAWPTGRLGPEFINALTAALAARVCRLKVAPATSMCSFSPSTHAGWPSSTLSMEE